MLHKPRQTLDSNARRQLCLPPPDAYADALGSSVARATRVRDAIADADLPPADRGALEATVRAGFARWLVDSAKIREVVDLLQLGGDDGE